MPSSDQPLLTGGFWFLRHGESETNARGLIAGTTDAPLTAHGRAQALAAAALLHDRGLRAVISSPLSRAAETARIVANRIGAPIRFVGGLRERNWGRLENQPLAARRDRFVAPPGGESWQDFRERTWAALVAIEAPSPTLVVAHSGTFRVLRDRLCGGDDPKSIGNALPLLFEATGRDARWRAVPAESVMQVSEN